MLHPIDVLQPVVAAVEQPGTRREIVLHELTRGPREQDLTPVSGRTDPCRSMHTETDITVFAHDRLGRVQPHADAHMRSFRPLVRCQPSLSGERGRGGILRAAECHEEGVPLGVDFAATRLFKGSPENALMLFEHLGIAIAQGLEQARRPLDVCEQEGDRPL